MLFCCFCCCCVVPRPLLPHLVPHIIPPTLSRAVAWGTQVWVIAVNCKYERVAEGTPGAQQMTGAELGRECS